ncbi:S9 family peptidase [Fundicoccus culcitae]|uniref:S9 family peptidase n=1 Tax=Fundicoccus culcitae TaxID=2969821 RepID=A0ABY5P3T7_9LACT|nr:S9 family peptidase [Fundicoccus culcitae]UUX33398.1 S9 family peptidase [Fundicoccus culcitae]
MDHFETVLIENGFLNKYPHYLEGSLLYVSNASGLEQVYLFDFETGESRQLTACAHGVTSLAVNAAKGSFLFTTQLGEESTQYSASGAPFYRYHDMKILQDGMGFLDKGLANYLCEYDLASGEVEVLTPQSTGYGLRRVVSVSADGESYVLEQLREPRSDYNFDTGLVIYDRRTKAVTWLTEAFPTGIFGEAVFSPDQSKLAFIGNPLPYETSNQFQLYVFDFEKGVLRQLAADKDVQYGDNSVSDVYQNVATPFIQWAPSGDVFYVVTSEYGQVLLNEVTLDGDIRVLSPERAVVKEFVVKADGRLLAVMSQPTQPVGLYHFVDGDWLPLPTQVAAVYDGVALADYTEMTLTAADGGVIHGLLCLPLDLDVNHKYPLILNIHGGPYTMHAWNFYHEAQYLAANGYAVLLVNPRGSYGYGQKHTKGVYERYGKEDYTDLMAAVDDVVARFSWVDSERLYVTGGSYGGYMTNWIVTQTQRFKAAVSQRSMSNFVSMFGTSDIGYYFYKDEMGLDISQPERLWEVSPLAYVDQVETPLLLLHAKDDLRCPLEQAQQFYIGLKHFGREAELMVFPNSSHELSRSGRPSYRVVRLEAMLGWFETY